YAVLYFWAYIASFNISNQMCGDSIAEDQINKPDRPLPSGLVTLRGAQVRFAIAAFIFLITGWIGGFVICSITWLLVIYIHNFLGLADRWGVKSWSMTTGTIAMLSAAWMMGGAPLSVAPFTWLATIAFLLFPTCPIQDIRDQEGDKSAGRKTLPLLIGDRNARWVLFVVFILNPFVTLFVSLTGPWEVAVFTGALIAFNAVIFAISWTIAFRLVLLRNKAADHRSYMLYTYWFVPCLAFGIFLL
ncbi:MAG TPA: UbiA family prenyltransferase, partial [Phototrophicaceae bacterium]|nr:UbiA family prenyltransferase [Phototrophicaceae bacterium]